MKNRRILILLIAMTVTAASACSRLSHSTPTATLKVFYEASKKKDASGMKKSLSKGSLAMFEKQAKEQNKPVDDLLTKVDTNTPDKMPETRNEKITGDTATLEVKNDQNGNWDTLPFVKEDGEWKIAFDKFVDELMKGLGTPNK
jgi:hypothetical protein